MRVALVKESDKSFTKIFWCSAPSSVNTQLPRLDLLYISSLLEKNGIENDIIDVSELKNIYDYYVFHVSKQTLDRDLEALFNCHLVGKTIVFGCDVSAEPSYWTQFEFIDYVVVGEPEATVLSIVSGKPKIDLNLNGLYPNYKKTGIEDYRCAYIKARHFVVSLSSRGCPRHCLFCSSHLLFNRVWRPRTAYDVAYEMKAFEDMGAKTVWYYDDCFTLDRQRVFNICNYIDRFGVHVNWKTQIRADCLDLQMIYALHDAGCYELGIGVESGNQSILDKNGKGIKLETIRRVFKECNAVGMQTVAFFMLGMAYETQDSIQDTIEFAKELDPTYAQFVLATPYKGTEFYKLAEREGWLVHEESSCLDDYGLIMNDLNPEIMQKLLHEANRSFYMRPRYLFKQLKHPSLEKLKSLRRII